jgi:hypothetical protein
MAVYFSYNRGAKEGVEYGVNYCLSNLQESGIIDIEIDETGDEIIKRVRKFKVKK